MICSPHMHCLLWIADVTQYGVNDTVEVAQYIDQVISFQRTWDDEELDRLVELQVHKHIRTCNTHALTHSLLRLTSEGRTSTTSDPAPITTASRLRTRDPLPPVVSRSSLADQVDWTLPVRGRASALREVDTVLEDSGAGTSGGRRQTCPSNECLLSAVMRGRSVSFVWLVGDEVIPLYVQDALYVVPSCKKHAVGPCRKKQQRKTTVCKFGFPKYPICHKQKYWNHWCVIQSSKRYMFMFNCK